ncbi:MAG TPA: protein kinase [Thermoanaerobaculia bacterium]|jgi:serine/threonine-protein kinase|nr:protein kinase [Thermoanaerobaculia bacterium]
MSILPPELDANYELLEEMHEGGMGAVYKARHRHLDEPCVIKVMHSRLNDIVSARDRFFREAKQGKQLRHRNIAEVLAFFVASDGKAYLVMEYVDGENLREFLTRQGPLPARLVAAIGIQALSALAYLHSRQIIHRDISPDNLMLTTGGTDGPLVKLIDLGIAKSLDETMSLTGTGLFIGKIRYASPEQFMQNVDARSDLYSLGVVLYELATGASPVRETDTMAIIAASLRNEPLRPFSETDPQGRVPLNLRAVVLKALQKKPEDRFQTASEFKEALQEVLAAADRTTLIDTTPPAEPQVVPVQVLPVHIVPLIVPAPAQPIPVEPTPWRRVSLGLALLLVLGAFGAIEMLRGPQTASQSPVTASVAIVPRTSVPVKPPKPVKPKPVKPQPATPKRKQSAAEAITRGKRLIGERKIEQAYEVFAEATRADPGNAFAWANFGGAAALLEKPDEASRAYGRALAIDPSNWMAHYNLACQLTASGAQEEALQHLEVTVTQLRLQTQSRNELAAVMSTIRADEALRELRNDSRFTELLSLD